MIPVASGRNHSLTTHKVVAYTDGSARGNPGPGGWGVVLRHEATGAIRHIWGADPDTTNNKMEIMGVIQALTALNTPCEIVIYTDSQYVRDSWNYWLPGWIERGWKRLKSKKPLKNVELWQELVEVAEPHEVVIEWVRGHVGYSGNEEADRLATSASEHYEKTGEIGPWSRRIA